MKAVLKRATAHHLLHLILQQRLDYLGEYVSGNGVEILDELSGHDVNQRVEQRDLSVDVHLGVGQLVNVELIHVGLAIGANGRSKGDRHVANVGFKLQVRVNELADHQSHVRVGFHVGVAQLQLGVKGAVLVGHLRVTNSARPG